MRAPLGDQLLDDRTGAFECLDAFRRERLARLGVGRLRQHVVEGQESLLALRIEVQHGGEQRVADEMRAEIGHGVEFVAALFDRVQHFVDDLGDARFQPGEAARGKGRQQQPADAGVPLAVHLGDELHAHELVELLEAGPARHFRGEAVGTGEHFLHVGIAAAHHLRRPVGEHVERWLRAPSRQEYCAHSV